MNTIRRSYRLAKACIELTSLFWPMSVINLKLRVCNWNWCVLTKVILVRGTSPKNILFLLLGKIYLKAFAASENVGKLYSCNHRSLLVANHSIYWTNNSSQFFDGKCHLVWWNVNERSVSDFRIILYGIVLSYSENLISYLVVRLSPVFTGINVYLNIAEASEVL